MVDESKISDLFLWRAFYVALRDAIDSYDEDYGEIGIDSRRGELWSEFTLNVHLTPDCCTGVAHVFGPTGTYLGNVSVDLPGYESRDAYAAKVGEIFVKSFKEKIGWSPVWRESEE